MAIYTRTGDDGTTALYGGRRLLKSNSQVEAYGFVDELTSTLGVFLTYLQDDTEKNFIGNMQKDLYAIMGFLADAPTDLKTIDKKVPLFEKKIDVLTAKLPPLTQFILPQGSKTSCWAHMARVCCRRTERAIVYYFDEKKTIDASDSQIILKYINRLSDLLFTYARAYNTDGEIVSKNK